MKKEQNKQEEPTVVPQTESTEVDAGKRAVNDVPKEPEVPVEPEPQVESVNPPTGVEDIPTTTTAVILQEPTTGDVPENLKTVDSTVPTHDFVPMDLTAPSVILVDPLAVVTPEDTPEFTVTPCVCEPFSTEQLRKYLEKGAEYFMQIYGATWDVKASELQSLCGTLIAKTLMFEKNS